MKEWKNKVEADFFVDENKNLATNQSRENQKIF